MAFPKLELLALNFTFFALVAASHLRRNSWGDTELYPWSQVWNVLATVISSTFHTWFSHSGIQKPWPNITGEDFKCLIWSMAIIHLPFGIVFSQIHCQVASSKSKKLKPRASSYLFHMCAGENRIRKARKQNLKDVFLPLSLHEQKGFSFQREENFSED